MATSAPPTHGPSEVPVAAPLGLRARQKAARRLHISNVATGLFLDRGFEAVTLAEIADAADISVKTIFNYFAAKEDLFYDRVPEIHDELERLVRERRAGSTASAALREDAARRWAPFPGTELARLEDPRTAAALRTFHRCAEASPALVARERADVDRLAARLAAVLAEDAPRTGAPALRLGGALLAGARREVHRELSAALRDGVAGATVVRRTRRVADLAFTTADAALACLGLAVVRGDARG